MMLYNSHLDEDDSLADRETSIVVLDSSFSTKKKRNRKKTRESGAGKR